MKIIFGFLTLIGGILGIIVGFAMLSDEFYGDGFGALIVGLILTYGGGRILAKDFGIIS